MIYTNTVVVDYSDPFVESYNRDIDVLKILANQIMASKLSDIINSNPDSEIYIKFDDSSACFYKISHQDSVESVIDTVSEKWLKMFIMNQELVDFLRTTKINQSNLDEVMKVLYGDKYNDYIHKKNYTSAIKISSTWTPEIFAEIIGANKVQSEPSTWLLGVKNRISDDITNIVIKTNPSLRWSCAEARQDGINVASLFVLLTRVMHQENFTSLVEKILLHSDATKHPVRKMSYS